MVDVVYGDSQDPGLPPVQLPAMGGEPPGPTRVEIDVPKPRPQAPATGAGNDTGPWAPLPDTSEPAAPALDASKPPAAPASPDTGPWAPLPPPDEAPVAPQTAPPDEGTRIGKGEAGARGVANAVTFGAAPAIAGAAAASGLPDVDTPLGQHLMVVKPFVGFFNLLHEWLADHPDPSVSDAYNKGRQDYLGRDKQAMEQNPIPYIAGQLVGSLAVPLGGAGVGGSALARVGKSVLAGGVGGGLYGAGDTISSGDTNPTDIAKEAGKGAVAGGVLGGAGSVALEGAAAVGKRAMQIARGKINPDQEAASRVTQNIAKDFADNPVADREAIAAGHAAGTPLYIADAGGENTRALLRSAANMSPSARNRISEKVGDRFKTQAARVSDWVKSKVGGTNAANAIEDLETAARKSNRPRYKLAYEVGDARFPRGIWSAKLEQLAGSDAVPQAAQEAATRGRNRAAAEGFGAFNPKVTFDNGILKISKGKGGIPTFPDMRFWDLTQRALRDQADVAERQGAKEQAGAIRELRRQLVDELDHMVPEFAEARGNAAKFFKAADLVDAGRKFVRMKDVDGAAREIAKMKPAERQLFKIGFASELASTVENTRDGVNVVNQAFMTSPAARKRIMMAMGATDARELEALLRIETIVHKTFQALQNSTTVRQAAEAGLAGAGAVGAYEGLKEGDFNPVHIFAGALMLGAIRHGAHKIDNTVAERVAEMLMSSDPKVLARGYKIVTHNPVLFGALRAASNATERELAEHLGFANVAAGTMTGLNNLRHLGEHEGDAHHHDQSDLYDQGVGQQNQ